MTLSLMTLSETSLPRLLVLTDRAQLPPGVGLVDRVAACVKAGATHVIVRELDLADGERGRLAVDLAGAGASVIAAHRAVVGAIGVHVPSDQGNVPTLGRSDHGVGPTAVDSPVGPTSLGSVNGRSCHSREDVAEAAAAGFDFATLGPFAETASKPGYGPAIDRTQYTDLPIPTYALGGITPDNARAAIRAGAYGVAVMGAVMRAQDPDTVVRELLEATA